MGRHRKRVMTEEGVDRRRSGYYSTPKFVADFMAQEMMSLNPHGRLVFDPCVGKEELLDRFHSARKAIHSMDIVDYGVHRKAHFQKKDFIGFYREKGEDPVLAMSRELEYDYYIANPPYNCHESEYIRKEKTLLKKLFGKVGVANMYSMFIGALIDLAKPGSVIGLITNDSFLTSRAHKALREKILDSCRITHLLLSPVDLFWSQRADVRTCILIMVKENQKEDQEIYVLNRPDRVETFRVLLKTRKFFRARLQDIMLTSAKDYKEFVIGAPRDVLEFFNEPRIGDVFKCVTGISTGNDRKYLSKVRTRYFCVPFYKNPASRRFYVQPDAYLPKDFLEIEQRVPNFMVRNKAFLFKTGITCSSMGIPFGACELPEGATYGVNASLFCNKAHKYWVLAYLNSSLVTYLVRAIMLRTNMITSGYVSRIPVVQLSKQAKLRLTQIAKRAVREKIGRYGYSREIAEIDEIVFEECGLAPESRAVVVDFCQNLMRRT